MQRKALMVVSSLDESSKRIYTTKICSNIKIIRVDGNIDISE